MLRRTFVHDMPGLGHAPMGEALQVFLRYLLPVLQRIGDKEST